MAALCLCVCRFVCTCSVCVCEWKQCALRLSCAADMWLIRCHQCVFETGCFIHSHPIAYIFNSSPRERQRRRAERKIEGKGERFRKNDMGVTERRGRGRRNGRHRRVSKERCGDAGEKLNVNSQLIIPRISILESGIRLNK